MTTTWVTRNLKEVNDDPRYSGGTIREIGAAPSSAWAIAPVVRFASVVGDGQDRHLGPEDFVEHGVGESSQDVLPVPFVVQSPSQRGLLDSIDRIEDFGSKGLRREGVTFAVPKVGVADLALCGRGKLNGEVAHRAFSRARASPQGTARTAPERRSLLRLRISAAQASVTESSPSKLSSSRSATADLSSGSSERASSMRRSTCAVMVKV